MYIIGYGSLMNKDEFSARDYKLVRVLGWRRVFNKVAARGVWREKIDGDKKATLNVVNCKESRFNAVVMKVDKRQFDEIVAREKGYYYKKVQCMIISSGEVIEAILFIVNSATGEIADEILPIDAYLEVCRKGAYSFGEDFGKEFDRTTYLSDEKTTVADYILEP
jgi:cation transport regulator ChaC